MLSCSVNVNLMPAIERPSGSGHLSYNTIYNPFNLAIKTFILPPPLPYLTGHITD